MLTSLVNKNISKIKLHNWTYYAVIIARKYGNKSEMWAPEYKPNAADITYYFSSDNGH